MSKVAVRHDVSHCKSAAEVLDASGLNWEPEFRAAQFVGQETGVPVKDWRAVVNPSTNQVIAYTGTRFRPNSHVKAVTDLDEAIRHGALVPHNVNVWDGGGKMALQFQAPDLTVQIGSKSKVSPLLTLYIHHDSEGSDRSFFADFDFWCKNMCGMVAKIQGEGVRHGSGVQRLYARLVEERILSVKNDLADRRDVMRRMVESPTRIQGKALVEYFSRVLDLAPDSTQAAWDLGVRNWKARQLGEPTERPTGPAAVLQDVVDCWRQDDHGAPGTVWHAYSAVTRYSTHVEGRQEGTRMLRALTGLQSRYDRAFGEAARLVA